MKTADSYRAALDAAIKEYERLGEQRRNIDRRLSQLAQSIGTLSRLLGLVPTVPLGLTDACRLVLRGGVPMTPTEVRDRLLEIGMDLSVYASDMSAVHTTLKRLHEAGEIRLIPRPDGRKAYVWHTPPATVVVSPEVADRIRQSGQFHIGEPAGSKRKARRRKK